VVPEQAPAHSLKRAPLVAVAVSVTIALRAKVKLQLAVPHGEGAPLAVTVPGPATLRLSATLPSEPMGHAAVVDGVALEAGRAFAVRPASSPLLVSPELQAARDDGKGHDPRTHGRDITQVPGLRRA
jgi:hypothetical protein